MSPAGSPHTRTTPPATPDADDHGRTSLARTTTYVRDTTSQRVSSITDPLIRQTDFTYDTAGNLTSVTRLSGTGKMVTVGDCPKKGP
jgi:YD repeat-containing protein